MVDLVSRLRTTALAPVGFTCRTQLREAADEIERLRRALANVKRRVRTEDQRVDNPRGSPQVLNKEPQES